MSRSDQSPPVRAIIPFGLERAVSGDDAGLSLWDTSGDVARLLTREECGPVSSLAFEEESAGQRALLVGRRDGRMLRFRIASSGSFGRSIGELSLPSSAPIAHITAPAGSRWLMVVQDDGTAWTARTDLIGKPTRAGSARAIAGAGSRVARLIDGPAVEIGDLAGQAPPRRFSLPRPVNSVALAQGGRYLIVGGEKSLLLAALSEGGAIPPGGVRERMGYVGAVAIASSHGGRMLAVGDATGRVELLDGASLSAAGLPMCLDDAPDWAFEPLRRFPRPRPAGRSRDFPAGILDRLDSARDRLDRGSTSGLAIELRKLAELPDLPAEAVGEALAMVAELEQRGGGSTMDVSRILDAAGAAFDRGGCKAREADMLFWQGLLLARPLTGDGHGSGRRSSTEAVDALRSAAHLYRGAGGTVRRQASLCEAAQAWVVLDLGRVREATRLFAPVIDAARVDPVLGQVVELDRVASALALARGDWMRAASIDARILDRGVGDDPAIRREAALNRAASLAALGRWREAAASLDSERTEDAEWTIRRAVCRFAAGLPVSPPASGSDEDPALAHVRALIAIQKGASGQGAGEDLSLAAAGHRLAGREVLATEAELAHAATLERSRRHAEASELLGSILRRGIRTLGGGDPPSEFHPIQQSSGRALRGLARNELAGRRPANALAAVECAHEDCIASVRSGEAGIPALGLAASEFGMLEDLREAEAALARSDEAGANTERGEASIVINRLRTELAGRDRAAPDPTTSFPTTAIKLGDDEAMLLYRQVGPRSIVGFLLKNSGDPIALPLPIERGELEREIRSWRATIGDGGRPVAPRSAVDPLAILGLGIESEFPGSPSTSPGPGSPERRLHDALIRPFETQLAGVRRLYLSPDCVLAMMPLEVIGRDSRLLERFSVRYVPSATILPALRDDQRVEPAQGWDVLFLASEVRPALQSLAESSRSSGWTSAVLSGAKSRPDVLLGQKLSRYTALHFDANAVIDKDRSASGDSEILLSPGGTSLRQDGRLSAGDLASLPLRAKVVVLAIRDAEGISGEGLLRLVRSALMAGSESVVATLWTPPDDSSRAFFETFYRELRSGSSTHEAFLQARVVVARDRKFREPVHWAGYVYYGP